MHHTSTDLKSSNKKETYSKIPVLGTGRVSYTCLFILLSSHKHLLFLNTVWKNFLKVYKTNFLTPNILFFVIKAQATCAISWFSFLDAFFPRPTLDSAQWWYSDTKVHPQEKYCIAFHDSKDFFCPSHFSAYFVFNLWGKMSHKIFQFKFLGAGQE